MRAFGNTVNLLYIHTTKAAASIGLNRSCLFVG